jgi:hypothetical protein
MSSRKSSILYYLHIVYYGEVAILCLKLTYMKTSGKKWRNAHWWGESASVGEVLWCLT